VVRTASLNDDPTFMTLLPTSSWTASRESRVDRRGRRWRERTECGVGTLRRCRGTERRDTAHRAHRRRPRRRGSLATTQFADRTIDLGADGFLARRPEAVELVRELGIGDQLEAVDASGASIWLRGALNELPTGLAWASQRHRAN